MNMILTIGGLVKRNLFLIGFLTIMLLFSPMAVIADVTQTYNFAGTLANEGLCGGGPFPACVAFSVTGQFQLDLTSGSIPSFNFTAPTGTIDATNYVAIVESFA